MADTDEHGRAVLVEAVDAYHQALGDRLLAAYALGSLAHGGFSALVSDVDLGLVLADPLSTSYPGAVQGVADAVKATRSALHERLSVFWGTPSTLRGDSEGGRFPPLDRLDLLENGRLLYGEDVRAGLPRPSAAELLVVGAEFALDFLGPGPGQATAASARLGSMTAAGHEVMEEVRKPELLVARGTRQVTKTVLFPVRFLFTAATGRVGTNEAAVARYLADNQAPAAELVAAALAWRTAPPDQDDAATLLEQQLLPLYLLYINDHTARLNAVGRPDLAAAFEEWGRALVR